MDKSKLWSLTFGMRIAMLPFGIVFAGSIVALVLYVKFGIIIDSVFKYLPTPKADASSMYLS